MLTEISLLLEDSENRVSACNIIQQKPLQNENRKSTDSVLFWWILKLLISWKSLSFSFGPSVSAVSEARINISCDFKHLFFGTPANIHFKFNFIDFMFLSIVLTCIKFSFLEQKFLGSRGTWEAAICWGSCCLYPCNGTSVSSSHQTPRGFSLQVISTALST